MTQDPKDEEEGFLGAITLLRELREEDMALLASWANDPALASLQVTGPIHPRVSQRITEMFRTFGQTQSSDVGLSIVQREEHSLVGHIMLYGADVKDRCATLSIMIGPTFQRHGYGSDAIRTMVHYGFNELGLHRIELTVNAFNTAGVATYTKLGFVEEGRRRQAIFRGGRWHDHIMMGLLAHEWNEGK